MPNMPSPSAKNDTGEFDRFNDLMRRVLSVSKTELQRRLEEERTSKAASSSRDSGD
jgi:DNA-binding HxlR family transcriptional regulator